MPLCGIEQTVRPGDRLRGRAEHDGAALVRFRAEATTFRLDEESATGKPRWLSESRVVHWEEQPLGPGETDFRFEVPASCLPSTLGERVRVAYHLELLEEAHSGGEALEIRVLSRSASTDGEAVVLRLGDAQSPEAALAEGLLDPAGADDPDREPRSWLEQFLEGKNRMDRILERAVRGKLVDPEELLAMQATMYGYSRSLAQLKGGHERPASRHPGAPGQPALVLQGGGAVPAGGAMQMQLRVPHELKVNELAVRLVQHENSRCYGVETRLERVVEQLRLGGRLSGSMELRLPRRLCASVQGPHLEIRYELTAVLLTDHGPLHGLGPVRVLAE